LFFDILQDARVRALEDELKKSGEELSRLKTASSAQEQAELGSVKSYERNLKDRVNVFVILE
jgi:hypothetical protein